MTFFQSGLEEMREYTYGDVIVVEMRVSSWSA
jgi:hypothetical protein